MEWPTETISKLIVLVMRYRNGKFLAHLLTGKCPDTPESHLTPPLSHSHICGLTQFQGFSYNAHTDESQVISSLELSRELQSHMQPAASLKSPVSGSSLSLTCPKPCSFLHPLLPRHTLLTLLIYFLSPRTMIWHT